MAQLTPRDDTKKAISEILKRVDQLLKAGQIEPALLEIERAKRQDPRNVYVKAYGERIQYLIEQRQQQIAAELQKKRAEEEQQLKAAEESRRKAEEVRQRSLREAEMRKPDQVRPQAQPVREEPRKYKPAAEQPPAAPSDPMAGMKEEALKIYRKVLEEVWIEGAVGERELEQLHSLRTSFLISNIEHDSLERDVRHGYYQAGLHKTVVVEKLSPDSDEIKQLQTRYKISLEDHREILARIQKTEAALGDRDEILFIDDDEKLLFVVAEMLEEAGYMVKAVSTSDEAFAILQNYSPDLIISDINLETSTMGGFTFYQKVQELDHATDIPFIFLSGLTDEVLIRTGKELGVDDYVTKPFSNESLLAVVRGKIKRYEQR